MSADLQDGQRAGFSIPEDSDHDGLKSARPAVIRDRDSGTEPEPETISILLPGGVPLQLVKIPAGSFEMGTPESERGRYPDEGPLHTVSFDYTFYMGKYEVTQSQWLALMGSWPGSEPSASSGIGDNRPAYNVSCEDVADYLFVLNNHIQSSGQGPLIARLPSEAEWEYACRAGTTTRFSFGDSLSVGDECEDGLAGSYPGNRTDYMWFCGNNGSSGSPDFGTKDVGSLEPNPWGLYDMHGNVWEWCQDDWHDDYAGAPTDGSAWGDGSSSQRVGRGSCWDQTAMHCRSAIRGVDSTNERSDVIGFRLVAAEGEKALAGNWAMYR